MASKKKKYIQRELKPLFVVKWKYLSGERGFDCRDSGETRMEAVTADEAERIWLLNHNYAQRKFKVLSVTEESESKNNEQQTNNETTKRKSPRSPETESRVGTSREHGIWDDVPDF